MECERPRPGEGGGVATATNGMKTLPTPQTESKRPADRNARARDAKRLQRRREDGARAEAAVRRMQDTLSQLTLARRAWSIVAMAGGDLDGMEADLRRLEEDDRRAVQAYERITTATREAMIAELRSVVLTTGLFLARPARPRVVRRGAPRARRAPRRAARVAAVASAGSGAEGPPQQGEPPGGHWPLGGICGHRAGALVCSLAPGHLGKHSNGWAMWRDSDVKRHGGRVPPRRGGDR